MNAYANHICNSGGQTHGPQVEVPYELVKITNQQKFKKSQIYM